MRLSKTMLQLSLSIMALFIHLTACSKVSSNSLDKIELPKGFKIKIFADNVPNARAMALGDQGTVFVGSRRAGKVYAIVNDKQNPGKKMVKTIAKGLQLPTGIAYKEGALYVAEVSRVLRFDQIEDRLDNVPKPVVINDTLPTDTHHGWKYLGFGPDDKLYLQVGAPCNVCLSKDPRYATIMRMNADGTGLEIYAQGVRNSVGFDWHPKTKELWFTENGRDWLGDDLPPCELNKAPTQGHHFGFPFCHGGFLADPKFGHLKNCKEFTPPMVNLGPHVAPLGMTFYTGQTFPKIYQNKIFIAEHGSWNRSKKIGYRITLVDPDNSPQESYQVFAKGWLQGENAWGRPVDLLVLPDGSLLVSDDYAGVIYQISYET